MQPMIPCPKCEGSGRGLHYDGYNPKCCCTDCMGKGTCPDRRQPTANDRGVEKALARADEVYNYCADSLHGEGYKLGVADMARIIREEATRDE